MTDAIAKLNEMLGKIFAYGPSQKVKKHAKKSVYKRKKIVKKGELHGHPS